ncbi:MAG: ISAs1 family transposase [Bryobacteraceae bacterium]
MSSSGLAVRPIVSAERARFDETLRSRHWLGAGLVGEVMRYVAEENGEWVALVGFGSAALCVGPREELVSWSDAQRYRRLRFVTNNQRFCVLDEHRRANLASEVLARTLHRLSADFEARWRHPVVMVETFTDPARHLGTCYKASNFAALGTTSGFGRRAGRFVHHGEKKAYWLRTLRRDALRLLAADFDPPALSRGGPVPTADLNRLDLQSLLEELSQVPDPRRPRGIRHQLPQILCIATLATLRGATSLYAIGELANELPQEALARLGCRVSPRSGLRVAPEESTIRRTLRAIDADRLDDVVNAWTRTQIAAGRLEETETPEVDFSVMVDDDERDHADHDDSDHADHDDSVEDNGVEDNCVAVRDAVALDGKTLRGARLEDDRKVHLVSVLTHREGATIAQLNVDTKTNEITAFQPLLESLDLEGVVVTADAMHTQREHARFLVGRGAHYIFGLKDNQPGLAAAAERLLADSPVVHETHNRGHGRIEHRYISVVDVPPEIAEHHGFASAAQFIKVDRERCDLGDHLESRDVSYYVTDLDAKKASPGELAVHIRCHWHIENRSHYVRDRTFDEDRCQVRVGGAPQALATLRNLAISILRLAGFKNIASGLRWMAFDHQRSFALLGL